MPRTALGPIPWMILPSGKGLIYQFNNNQQNSKVLHPQDKTTIPNRFVSYIFWAKKVKENTSS
jgi:hypothetical protein